MIAAMEITDDTPMTIPSTVSAERTLDERSVSMAARKFSLACASVMIVIRRTSRQPPGRAVTTAPRDKFRRDRKSVVSGKSVDLGGGRGSKKKKEKYK